MNTKLTFLLLVSLLLTACNSALRTAPRWNHHRGMDDISTEVIVRTNGSCNIVEMPKVQSRTTVPYIAYQVRHIDGQSFVEADLHCGVSREHIERVEVDGRTVDVQQVGDFSPINAEGILRYTRVRFPINEFSRHIKITGVIRDHKMMLPGNYMEAFRRAINGRLIFNADSYKERYGYGG